MSEHQAPDDESKKVLRFVAVATTVTFVTFTLVSLVWGSKSRDEWAHSGDSFGPINALFAGLAFAAVAYSIILQRMDLRQQYVEFKKSVEAQRESSEALKAQLKEMQHQTALSLWPFPLLVYESEGANVGPKRFGCKNFGTSLALNVCVWTYRDTEDGERIVPHTCSPLAVNPTSFFIGFPLASNSVQFYVFIIYQSLIKDWHYIIQQVTSPNMIFVVENGLFQETMSVAAQQKFIETYVQKHPLGSQERS